MMNCSRYWRWRQRLPMPWWCLMALGVCSIVEIRALGSNPIGFEVQGSASYETHPTGGVGVGGQRIQYGFSLAVLNQSWFLSIGNPPDRASGGWTGAQDVFFSGDGTNWYSLVRRHPSDDSVTNRHAGIMPSRFPRLPAHYHFLWVTYVSGIYEDGANTLLAVPPGPLEDWETTNYFRAHVERSDFPPFFLRGLSYDRPGYVVHDSARLPYPAPFQDGFREASLKVQEYLMFQGRQIPAQVNMERQGLVRSRDGKYDLARLATFRASVTNVVAVDFLECQPDLSPGAIVHDARFTTDFRMPRLLIYTQWSGVWPEMNDPHVRAAYELEMQLRRRGPEKNVGNRWAAVVIVAAVLLLPPLCFLVRKRYRERKIG
jgi:hypothetical protein